MPQTRSSNRTPESHSLWGAAALSAIFHAVALAAAFIVLPQVSTPLELPSDVVPVDLEIADETNVMQQQEAPEPPPEPQPQELQAVPEAQAVAEPPPPPPPAEDEFALAEDKSEPPPETKPVPPTPRFAMATPRAKPKPEKKKEEFDIDKIANLVEKIDSQPQKAESKSAPPQAKRTTKGVGAQAAMTANEIDAFRSQLSKCWNVPVGAPDPAALVFQIRIFLNQDGTVSGAPELIGMGRMADPYFRAAVDSAKRAVHMCGPYQLPPEKFASWSEITVEFDPMKMAGY